MGIMPKITDIENQIDSTFLSKFGFDINTTSNVSEWKTLRGLAAQIMFSVYMFFESFKSEVNALAQATEYGNARWWSNQILTFQYGDALSELNGKLYYADIHPPNQIVKRVAIVESLINQTLVVQIKVAKLNGVNSIPLTVTEKNALEFYILGIKPCGVATQVISVAADEVKVVETIYYDGKLEPGAFSTAMLSARKAYLADIVFNGQFNINIYRDALEAVCGAGNADIQSIQIRPNGGAYIVVGRTYLPVSGHYKLIEADCLITNIPS